MARSFEWSSADLVDDGDRSMGRPHSDDGPTAFEAFYRRELPSLVALARALAARSDVADDVAQEAMLVAYRRWEEVSALDNPRAWVRRVCANQAVSEYRRLRYEARTRLRLLARRNDIVQPASDEDPIWDLVRRLPRRQAQSLALLYIADLSIADIADILGCSVGAVKVHLSRGRHALAVAIGDEQEDLL